VRNPSSTLALIALLALTACTAPSPTAPASRPQAGDAPAQPAAPQTRKQLTLAVMEDVTGLWGNSADVVSELYLGGLVALDPDHKPRAQLAEAVPTQENGLWKVFPDGRMELTWVLREGVRWHDGTPLTAQDVVFSALAPIEFPDLMLRANNITAAIDTIQARDDRTVVATFKTPHARADWLFSHQIGLPFARHLVEETYRTNREGVMNLRYWSTEMVGSGPYVVREFVAGSHLELAAFDGYVLGRPRVDRVTVRFIPDPNTLMANLLAGTVDFTIGSGLSISQARQVVSGWREGKIVSGPPASSYAAYPQFVDPDPPLLANVQFRRALAHAVDRKEMVETLQDGLGTPAHLLIADKGVDYDAIAPRVERYEYDLRRSAQLLTDLGLMRGSDGMFRDAANQEIPLQMWAGEADESLTLATVEYLRHAGLAASSRIIPRNADASVMPSRPALQMAKLQTTLDTRFLSSQTPLPSNNFRGANRSRYQNPALDTLLDGYFAEVRPAEQTRLLGEIVKHIAENVVVIHLYYDVVPQIASNRVQNLTPRSTLSQTWNSHLWDLN
jgi:peptide/nickel transport system substrate-binding protein